MEIQFRPRSGIQAVELRDVSAAGLGRWNAGDKRSIPDGTVQINVFGEMKTVTIAEAVFRHGPDFVDAATGKNPLYACKGCGAEAIEQHVPDRLTLEPIEFVDDDGNRLCVTCFLADNPRYHADFIARGHGDHVRDAKAIIDRRTSKPIPPKPAAPEGE